MKTLEQRINNITGQLEGIKKMINDDHRDCFSVIVQLKAIRSAISSVMDKVVAAELDHCLWQEKNNKKKLETIFREVIKK